MQYALVCTQGEMTRQEILDECFREKWTPLVVYFQNGKTILPTFTRIQIARRFARKNFPEEWLTGAVNLNPQDIEIIEDKGIERVIFNYPNELKGAVEFDIIVHEFHPDTEVGVEFRGVT